MSVVSAFTPAILPIVAAAVGYAIGRRTGVAVDGLNAVALDFSLPALVFHGVATTDPSGRTAFPLAAAVAAYIDHLTHPRPRPRGRAGP